MFKSTLSLVIMLLTFHSQAEIIKCEFGEKVNISVPITTKMSGTISLQPSNVTKHYEKGGTILINTKQNTISLGEHTYSFERLSDNKIIYSTGKTELSKIAGEWYSVVAINKALNATSTSWLGANVYIEIGYCEK